MRAVFRALLSICVMSSAAPVVAALRQPAGQWHVDYDTAQCVATRSYGTDAKPLALVLKPSPNGSVMRLLIVRKGYSAVNQMPATLRLGAFQKNTNLLTYSDEKTHYSIVAINVPMTEFRAHLAASDLSVVGGGYHDVFALSDVPALMTELDKCVVDLQSYWNIGEAYKANVTTAAAPEQPLGKLFSAADYPGVALQENQQGRVTMTLLVDEQGGVDDCTVDETSGVAALDTMSCYVVQQRAHFRPALGRDGKPIRSAHTQRVMWKIDPKPRLPVGLPRH